MIFTAVVALTSLVHLDRFDLQRPITAVWFILYVAPMLILAYCLWAFEKSSAVGNPAWFELSIVPFVLGILRYALMLEQGGGGAPEELVLGDRVLLVIGAAWAVLFAIAVHHG